MLISLVESVTNPYCRKKNDNNDYEDDEFIIQQFSVWRPLDQEMAWRRVSATT